MVLFTKHLLNTDSAKHEPGFWASWLKKTLSFFPKSSESTWRAAEKEKEVIVVHCDQYLVRSQYRVVWKHIERVHALDLEAGSQKEVTFKISPEGCTMNYKY